MRQAFAVRQANGVSCEARAKAANLICLHGRISDGSGILFKKKIQRTARAAGNAQRAFFVISL
jgi:hypothetical protein